MDILILLLLLVTACLILLGISQRVILAFWLVTAALTIGLFQQHATSTLGLSF